MTDGPSRVRYVQRVRTRTGTLLYFRKGTVSRRLLSPDASDELRAEVQAILTELADSERSKAPRAGTVGGALQSYYRSASFLALARTTQHSYERLITELTADIGKVRLSEVDASWVDALKDVWARRGHRAANLRLQMLVNALAGAVRDGRVPADPFATMKRVKRPHDAPEPNPAWTEQEVQAVIALALDRKSPGLARAVGLGRWGGFRRGTICALPTTARVNALDEEGTARCRLVWRTEKRRIICDKVEDDRLTALLEATPDHGPTIAYNQRGGAWVERQLNQALDRLINTLAADGAVRPDLTLHGLRHARGVELALAGASDSEIMSQLEHADARTAAIYRRQAERRTMADSGQKRIDERRARQSAPAEANDAPSSPPEPPEGRL